jgi:hypothetical protein
MFVYVLLIKGCFIGILKTPAEGMALVVEPFAICAYFVVYF